MRTNVLLIASAIIGGFAWGLVLLIFVENFVEVRVEIRRGPTVSKPEAATVAPSDLLPSTDDLSNNPAPPPTTFSGDERSVSPKTPSPIVDRANELAAAGQAREAQELYFKILLVDPDDREAMRGLVRARRVLAGENPTVLRKQAEAYRRAISQGVETGENYTAFGMDLLATASLLAAAELEDSTAKERTAVSLSRPMAEPPAMPSDVRPMPPKPLPTIADPPVQRSPSPDPPLVDEPFVMITVGPINSGERTSTITTELTVAGYMARARRGAAGDYVITMGPYRRSVAERIATFIRSRYGKIPIFLSPSS